MFLKEWINVSMVNELPKKIKDVYVYIKHIVDTVNIMCYILLGGIFMATKSYHHGNLEEKLIEAGLEILDAVGIHGLSLRKVAAACDVSHAAPYKHFASKEELLDAMQKYVADRFGEALQNTLIQYSEHENKMLYFAQSYLRFFIEKPHYARFLTTQSGMEVNLSSLEEPSDYYPFEVFRKAAIQEVERYNVPEHLRQQTIISMWAMVHGVSSLAIMQGVHFKGDWQQLLKNIMIQNHNGG